MSQTSAFTYQGKLADNGGSANGTYQMRFSLFDASSGGTQVGSTITNTSVSVVNGVFTVQLDFSPATPFATGATRWLEVAVKKPADPGYTTLTPRQQIMSAPFAIRASSAANADTATNVSGVVAVANGGTGSATQNFVDLTTNQTVGGNKTFTGIVSGDGSALTNINGANITNNTVNASALASDTFPNNQNLSRLGQRRWDLLEQRVSVGNGPQFAAFDGANIWVANRLNNTVTKLRASDGACIGTCTFAVGSSPNGIEFDGANIWVANNVGSGTVTKLRASDGAFLGTFAVGNNPFGVAFDGASVWVTGFASNNVTKLRALDGVCVGTCTFATGLAPAGVAFDGENIWVANLGGNSVTKLRASDGSLQGTFALTAGSNPLGIAVDGANVWVANNNNNSVTKLRATDGACVGTCTFAVGTNPVGVAFDGANIWVANSGSNSVTKLRAIDGAVLGTFAVGTFPQGVAFDGASVWVVNSNSNNVVKLPVFP